VHRFGEIDSTSRELLEPALEHTTPARGALRVDATDLRFIDHTLLGRARSNAARPVVGCAR
jgi:hypothetical protein